MREVQLTLSQISAVNAIVLDVLDHWDDPARWREELLRGACHLLDAHIGTITGQSVASGCFGAPTPIAVFGMSQAMRKMFFEPMINYATNRAIADADTGAPGMTELFNHYGEAGWATMARGQITDDATYYASLHHKMRGAAECDDYLISVRGVDEPNRIEVMTVDRRPGQRRFDVCDIAQLKLLHDQVAPLVGLRLATEDHLCRDGLSKRLRETLQCLLDGQSEKETATSLGLSVRTIHQYVGMLYKHFRVRTRAELMAYFVRRRPEARSDRWTKAV